jgi:hypothetical protein
VSLTSVANEKKNLKNFNNFVGTPLDIRVNIYIHFCLKFTLRYPQPDISLVDTAGNLPPVLLTPSANLPPVLLTPVANLPPVSTTLLKRVAKFAAGDVDTGGKFATGVVDTGGNFAAGVVDTGGQPLAANISANFRKNLQRS